MKKTNYIAPAIEIVSMTTMNIIAGSPINPNGNNPFDGAEEGEDGEGGDVKGNYNVWDVEW